MQREDDINNKKHFFNYHDVLSSDSNSAPEICHKGPASFQNESSSIEDLHPVIELEIFAPGPPSSVQTKEQNLTEIFDDSENERSYQKEFPLNQSEVQNGIPAAEKFPSSYGGVNSTHGFSLVEGYQRPSPTDVHDQVQSQLLDQQFDRFTPEFVPGGKMHIPLASFAGNFEPRYLPISRIAPALSNKVRPPKMLKHCEETRCSVLPTFGYPGQAKRFCGRHKLEGMLDLKSKRCEFEGCCVVPSFGYEGYTRQFCGQHKLEGMVNMRGKRCVAPGCRTSPSFGYEEEGRSRYCARHKTDEMVDLMHKRCEENGCLIRPIYGYSGGPAIVCSRHRHEDMIKLSVYRNPSQNSTIKSNQVSSSNNVIPRFDTVITESFDNTVPISSMKLSNSDARGGLKPYFFPNGRKIGTNRRNKRRSDSSCGSADNREEFPKSGTYQNFECKNGVQDECYFAAGRKSGKRAVRPTFQSAEWETAPGMSLRRPVKRAMTVHDGESSVFRVDHFNSEFSSENNQECSSQDLSMDIVEILMQLKKTETDMTEKSSAVHASA